MDEGERGSETRTDFRTERRIKLQFRGACAHPWPLGRRDGIACGIYDRLAADGRFLDQADSPRSSVAPEHSLLCEWVFGSPFGFWIQARGSCVQQRKLRMMAREAAAKEVANRKPRQLSAHRKSFNCADAQVVDSVVSFTQL